MTSIRENQGLCIMTSKMALPTELITFNKKMFCSKKKKLEMETKRFFPVELVFFPLNMEEVRFFSFKDFEC